MSDQLADIFKQNAERVEAQIATACERAGRPRAAVKLVAVSKYVTPDLANLFVAATGIRELGESRPQELVRKYDLVADVAWHQVGHVQRNKIRGLLARASLIHSIDSHRLLTAAESEANQCGWKVPILIEVNITGEEAKHGFAPDEVLPLADILPTLQGVSVRGLMTMAALGSTAAEAQRTFAELRELRDQLAARMKCKLPELSMGMSGDFAEAIAEGATIVRIGSSLFEGAIS